MTLAEREAEIYQCPSCSRVKPDGESTCCGEQMEMVETTVAFKPPESEQMAKAVFGIASTELEICEVLMAEGEATAPELSEQLPHDRTTISRHLNHLVKLGMATKRSDVQDNGGRVNVYSFIPPDEIGQNLRLGLYMWAQEAMELADELTQAKIEAMAEQSDEAVAEEMDEAIATRPNTETTTEKTAVEGTSESESKEVEQGNSLINRLLSRDWLR